MRLITSYGRVSAISVAGRRFASRAAALILFALTVVWASNAALLDVVFYDNRYGSIDSSTGAWSQISTLPISNATGIALSNGSMYVEDAANNLLLVNPLTGSSRILGSAGVNVSFAVFAGGDAGLYGIDYASNLYSFNSQTGSATLIGSTGLAPNNGHSDTSLSFNGNSLLYTAGLPGKNDELYRVNITTGIATDLGNTGITAIAGSAFENGRLDVFQYGQSTTYMYSALDGSTAFGRGPALTVQIVDGGVVAPAIRTPASVPEPSTILMSMSTLATLAFFVCWKRPSDETAAE